MSQPNCSFQFILHDGLVLGDVAAIKDKLESNAGRILTNLNITDAGTIKVHIWNKKESFYQDQEKRLGVRYPYSMGYVIGFSDIAVLMITDPKEMIMMDEIFYSFIPEEVAEHEFAHCISLHIQINFANNPRWFWEVVAIHESGEFYDPRNIDYLREGNFPTIEELDADFLTYNYKIYQVGYLIGDFILSEWGKDKYIELIKYYGNIQKVLGITVEEFERKWKEFVESKYFVSIYMDPPLSNDYSLQCNPFLNELNLSYQDDLLTGGFYQIVDSSGKIILSGKITENHTVIDLSFLRSGMYGVSVYKGGKSFCRKIIL